MHRLPTNLAVRSKHYIPGESRGKWGLRQGIVQAPELTEEEKRPLIAALEKKGWLAPLRPKRYGGAGFELAQSIILMRNAARPACTFTPATELTCLASS